MRDRIGLMFLALLFTISFHTSAGLHVTASSSDESQIRALLETQTAAWNRGDIDEFMTGYWKSEETEFVSASGISHGWRALLERYHKSYPDRKTMGRLTFANLEIHVTCPDSAYAIGEFHLERENDKPAGVFTLNLRKFSDGWRVVADHTTSYAAPPSAKPL